MTNVAIHIKLNSDNAEKNLTKLNKELANLNKNGWTVVAMTPYKDMFYLLCTKNNENEDRNLDDDEFGA